MSPHTHSDIELGAQEFGRCLFLQCTYNTTAGQCYMCQASRHVIWLAWGFGLHLGVRWGWGFLAFTSNRVWTKPRKNFVVL